MEEFENSTDSKTQQLEVAKTLEQIATIKAQIAESSFKNDGVYAVVLCCLMFLPIPMYFTAFYSHVPKVSNVRR